MPNNKSYSKTKQELLTLASNLKNKYGNEYKLTGVRIDQVEGTMMLTVPMSVGETHLFFQRLPRNIDNPEGLQRALKQSKIDSIEDLASNNNRYTSPNSVVANIMIDDRKWGVRIEHSPKNNKLYTIVVNIDEIRKRVIDADVDGDYIDNEEDVMLGYLIDAHHRTEGFYEAGKLDFELPVTLYVNLPREEMAEVFVNINQFQEKPSATHTLAMRALSKSLSGPDEQAHNILEHLYSSDWSILHNRIKVFDGSVPKGHPKPYLNASTFHMLLREYMINEFSGELSELSKAQVINDYFAAWKEVFPEAWRDQNKHVLVKSMGFHIMTRLFEKIQGFASAQAGVKIVSKEMFVNLIKSVYKGETITIGSGSERVIIPMTWESEYFGAYSNGKGVNMIVAALKYIFTNNAI